MTSEVQSPSVVGYLADPSGVRVARIWCKYCHVWHNHAWQNGLTDAGCSAKSKSPYLQTGYALVCVAGQPLAGWVPQSDSEPSTAVSAGGGAMPDELGRLAEATEIPARMRSMFAAAHPSWMPVIAVKRCGTITAGPRCDAGVSGLKVVYKDGKFKAAWFNYRKLGAREAANLLKETRPDG